MKSFLLITILLVAAKTCRKSAVVSIPVCIQQKIDSIKKEEPDHPRAEVHEYSYRGKKVYFFTAKCCDFFEMVYDDDCNYVCAPSGGITGKGDGRCPDWSDAERVRVIWKDER